MLYERICPIKLKIKDNTDTSTSALTYTYTLQKQSYITCGMTGGDCKINFNCLYDSVFNFYVSCVLVKVISLLLYNLSATLILKLFL